MQKVIYGQVPKIKSARVIRTDGLFIKKFDYEELVKGEEYHRKWIDENMFNLIGIDGDNDFRTYWVN